ncbi:MAG TPA: MOSC N-terminal beta barrel domain-containing protein [Anaerolineales bacterium]|nr:MOSC N-terminal beta barrel domain-containing protein [Anaerolineales bacterium]
MAENQIVGSVSELWRFPVKSMRGERIEEAEVTQLGIFGDRAYALIDTETGKVVSAKSVRLFPNVLDCQVAFMEPPRAGQELPPLRITLPDGTSSASNSGDIDAVLSAYFKRDVRLIRVAPENFTIDQYHPDLEELDPQGHRNVTTDQKLGSALFAELGLPSPVPVGAFFDLFPVSVLTTSTLNRLNDLEPASRFEQRRFRMNVIIDTKEEGFVENGWIEKDLSVGNQVRLRVALPDPRCVMTTLPQADLPNDPNILRSLVRYNKIQVGVAGQYPCAGAYAVVHTPGIIRTGDSVLLAT